ncbi:MAG TPA: 4-deoxy-4-formamido-L-arabinose-phosphoundecaprenol deformylase [Gammaproteobacteria bacterium]|nr:4-deoxy-4-formamido-L-arabinose-phosphoundecaprenol deformylase [Gammaproteobacteria bacterium]
MMRIALKIDVDTLRGTLEGVPRLAGLLSRLSINATFLFSLGPDHTGRALRRLLRPGFVKKVMRTSVGSNYGLKTLCYGTVLPGPDIGRRGASAMRAVRDAGFEVGIHTWDHVRWQDNVFRRGEDWTLREMTLAAERFREVFGSEAKTIGAAGWQMNAHAFALEDEFGFDYASDTRGTRPFIPIVNGRRFHCPQLPTTLPTLDELIGRDGITRENVGEHIVAAAVPNDVDCHVLTLHAELEGLAYRDVFERVLREWQGMGFDLGSTGDLFETIDVQSLPVHDVTRAEVPGRSGDLAVQGERSRLL